MSAVITPFPVANRLHQVGFDRAELTQILNLYGRMVAAGNWRDYAIDLGRDAAIFSAFRRATERPEYRIEKRPELRNKQGQWVLVGEGGAVLKRGHELGPVLGPCRAQVDEAGGRLNSPVTLPWAGGS